MAASVTPPSLHRWLSAPHCEGHCGPGPVLCKSPRGARGLLSLWDSRVLQACARAAFPRARPVRFCLCTWQLWQRRDWSTQSSLIISRGVHACWDSRSLEPGWWLGACAARGSSRSCQQLSLEIILAHPRASLCLQLPAAGDWRQVLQQDLGQAASSGMSGEASPPLRSSWCHAGSVLPDASDASVQPRLVGVQLPAPVLRQPPTPLSQGRWEPVFGWAWERS